MPNYKKMYLSLFSDVTEVIETLKQAQQKSEEIYTESDEPELSLLSIAGQEKSGYRQ